MCGNRVLEPSRGEECEPGLENGGFACGAVGTVAECRYACAESSCPPGWGCGLLDGLCTKVSTELVPLSAPPDLEASELALGPVDGDPFADVIAYDRGRSTVAVHLARPQAFGLSFAPRKPHVGSCFTSGNGGGDAPMGAVAPDGLGMTGACRSLKIAASMARLAAWDGVPAAVADTSAPLSAPMCHR